MSTTITINIHVTPDGVAITGVRNKAVLSDAFNAPTPMELEASEAAITTQLESLNAPAPTELEVEMLSDITSSTPNLSAVSNAANLRSDDDEAPAPEPLETVDSWV